MDINYLCVASIFSVLAAILAWVAKLRWSDEFKQAKEAQIAAVEQTVKAKEAQISGLQEQVQFWKDRNPETIERYHKAVENKFQEIIQDLEQRLEKASQELSEAQRKPPEEREKLARQENSLRTEFEFISKLSRAILDDTEFTLEASNIPHITSGAAVVVADTNSEYKFSK